MISSFSDPIASYIAALGIHDVQRFFQKQFFSRISATTCFSCSFSCRSSVTSLDVASRFVSPASRFLPASRNSLLHR